MATVRELFAELGLDVDAQSFAKGQLAVELVKSALEKMVDVAKETVAAFVENIKATAEYGEHMIGLAQSTGLGTDSLQRLGAAAADEGIGIDDFGRSLVALSRNMLSAKEGSEEQDKAFKKVGVSVKDLHGKLRPTEDVFIDLADHFSKMPDGAEKTARSMQLLGHTGSALIPVLNKGREELEEYMRAQVMTREQLQAGNEVVSIQRKLAAQTKALWREAVGPLLPAIRDLLKRWLEWKKANAEILKQRIRAWIGYAIDGVKFLSNTLDFLIKNIDGIKVGLVALAALFVLTHISATASAVRTMIAWVAAAAPFVALAAIVAGLLLVFDDIRVYQQGGKSLYGRFKKEIDDWLKPNDKDPWFVAAIKDFVRYIKEAIEMVLEFEAATNRFKPKNLDKAAAASPAEVQRRADVQTMASARSRIAQGLQVTDAERAALVRQGVSEQAFVSKYTPEGAAFGPAAPSAGGGAQQTNYVQIVQQPGEDAEALWGKLRDKQEEWWSGKMQDAAAGSGE